MCWAVFLFTSSYPLVRLPHDNNDWSAISINNQQPETLIALLELCFVASIRQVGNMSVFAEWEMWYKIYGPWFIFASQPSAWRQLYGTGWRRVPHQRAVCHKGVGCGVGDGVGGWVWMGNYLFCLAQCLLYIVQRYLPYSMLSGLYNHCNMSI